MPDWIQEHRASIQFVIWTLLGVLLILVGLIQDNEHALIALGAGAIGLPGFQAVTREVDE